MISSSFHKTVFLWFLLFLIVYKLSAIENASPPTVNDSGHSYPSNLNFDNPGMIDSRAAFSCFDNLGVGVAVMLAEGSFEPPLAYACCIESVEASVTKDNTNAITNAVILVNCFFMIFCLLNSSILLP